LASDAGSIVFATYAWAAVIVVAVPVWLGVRLLPSRRLRWSLVRSAGKGLCAMLGIGIHVGGTPPEAGSCYVAVANHMSFIDGLVLIECLPEAITFVAGDVLESQRIAGPFLRGLGCEFVARDAITQELGAAQKLVEVLRVGRCLAAFPEGSVDRAVGVRPFHLGAFAAATENGVPVLPIGIRGSRDVVRPGGKFPRRSPIEVHIGNLISPAEPGWDSTLSLAHTARRAIAELSGEPMVG
jgi:1-acyl-sn-glycerol-3-phosphate acyltransferase